MLGSLRAAPTGIIRVVERCATPVRGRRPSNEDHSNLSDLRRRTSGAPGRTRTCNLLFRRWLSPDAVHDREAAGQQRPSSESYRVVGSSRFVTLSSENALSRHRAVHCIVDVGRRGPHTPGKRSSGRSLPHWTLPGTWPTPFLPDGHVRLICRLWLPRGTGAVRSRDWCTARRILGMPSPPLSDSRSPSAAISYGLPRHAG